MAYFDCIVGGSDGSTLTVTCYSGFAGLTISITNGTDTFSEVCPSTSPYEVVFDGLAAGTWTVSTVYGGQTYTKTVEINNSTTFNPMPNGATVTPVNNIQTWLLCGDIGDKNYTTITQVLADASTLQALIASNNAADYMARSTSWASSVTANANAMAYIGANDYCANKLLSNSTWRNAICNSTYFESVLNVKVPTMTGYNTPRGQVIYSSEYSGRLAWYAFNGNSSNFWSSNSYSNQYCGYAFPSAVNIRKVIITQQANNALISKYKIQYSDDNNTWYDATSVITATQTTAGSKEIVNNLNIGAHRYWLVYGTYGSDSLYVGATAIQFYGRA